MKQYIYLLLGAALFGFICSIAYDVIDYGFTMEVFHDKFYIDAMFNIVVCVITAFTLKFFSKDNS